MKLQLLSDLHLETETFDPVPAPGADLLVLAGDIDSSPGWPGYERFAGWPVPVLVVPGNHEFDDREMHDVVPALRAHVGRLGFTLLHRETLVLDAPDGRRIRFCGAPRWSDFDLFGLHHRARAERAAAYFLRLMQATRGGRELDAEGVRAEGLACRAWLEAELPRRGDWQATVAITHFGPSARSADPRYGRQPGTASFCNADDDLLPLADLWLHGHLHCRHDYLVDRAGRRPTRVVCQARGLATKGEAQGHDPLRLIEL